MPPQNRKRSRLWGPFFLLALLVLGSGNVPILGIPPPVRTGNPSPGSPRVALTFDDGPTPPYTEEILETLKSRGVKATFFVTGANVDTHPALLRRILADGHEIGNHTYTHPHLILRTIETTRQEIARTENAIDRAGGRKPRWFRPPYGQKDIFILKIARELGYQVVNWSVASNDWRQPGVGQIVERVKRRAKPGAIILLHDGRGDRSQTVAALPLILDALTAAGFRCVTLSDLLDERGSRYRENFKPVSAPGYTP